MADYSQGRATESPAPLSMEARKVKRHALRSWLYVSVLVILATVPGVVQYRWIAEVSLTERGRPRASLQASLQRLRQDFNAGFTSACATIKGDSVDLRSFDADKAKKQFSSGVIEGLNNKATVTVGRSYGFRTFRILELALYHSLGKLPEPELTHEFF